MRAKQIHEEWGQKTFVLVFDTDDEVIAELTNFAKEKDLTASSLTAIGAFSGARLGYFDTERKEYEEIPVEEQVEVLSMVGDIAPKEDGEPQVHAHVVLGLSDGATKGGHLLEARVRPTLEAVLVESPEHLQRKWNEEVGLALIDVGREA